MKKSVLVDDLLGIFWKPPRTRQSKLFETITATRRGKRKRRAARDKSRTGSVSDRVSEVGWIW